MRILCSPSRLVHPCSSSSTSYMDICSFISQRHRHNASHFTRLLVSLHRIEFCMVRRTPFPTCNPPWNRCSVISICSTGCPIWWAMRRTSTDFPRRSRLYSKSAWKKASSLTFANATLLLQCPVLRSTNRFQPCQVSSPPVRGSDVNEASDYCFCAYGARARR